MARLINEALMRHIRTAAMAGVVAAAASPSTAIKTEDVKSSSTAIQEKVTEAIANDPELQHVTGQEPWYKKRSRWSAILGPVFMVLGVSAGAFGINVAWLDPEQVATVLAGIGTLWSAYLAYRAGTASKPLFS